MFSILYHCKHDILGLWTVPDEDFSLFSHVTDLTMVKESQSLIDTGNNH